MKDRALILSRLEWGFALAATAGSLILHWRWMLHAGGLWRDEAATAQFATMPGMAEIWRNLAYDNFPPLVLVPLRLWVMIGGVTDAGWRWFGLLMGIALLACLWLAGRMCGTRTPLMALAFVGLSPLAVRTIDSIRPYGLGTLLTCLSLGCFWLAARAPNRRNAVLVLVAAVLCVQCLYSSAAFVLGSACGAVVLALRQGNRRGAVIALAAGAAAALSLLIHAAHLSAGRKWGIVAQPAMATTFSYLVQVAWASLLEEGPLAALVMIVAVPALYLWRGIEELFLPEHGPQRRTREERDRQRTGSDTAWFAGTALAIGLVAYAGLLLSTRLPTQPWYYVILIAFVALCLDVAVRASEPARWCRLAFALAAGLFAIGSAWSGTAVRQTNVDQVARQVQASADKEDFILIYPWYHAIGWQRYYHGAAPWLTVPPLVELRIHRYDLLKEQMMRTNQGAVMEPVLDRMRAALQSGHRVWLVGGLPPPLSGQQSPPTLVPAPDGDMGWNGEAYETIWGQQALAFLQEHATQLDRVPVPSPDPVSRFENVNLNVVEGWRMPLR